MLDQDHSLMYADSDICLLADDDIRYYDNVEKKVMNMVVNVIKENGYVAG